MFGYSKQLNNITIRYFSKPYINLAGSIEALKLQLDMCVHFLNLMIVTRRETTYKDSTSGSNYRSRLQNLQLMEGLFVIPEANFRDWTFQDFINDWGINHLTRDIPSTIQDKGQQGKSETDNRSALKTASCQGGLDPPQREVLWSYFNV